MNDRPARYIDGLDFYTDAMDSLVTIEDLLAHRSGIGNCDASMVFFPTNDLIKNAQRIAHLPPSSPFRQGLDYSNMGYALLGAIVENVGKDDWPSLIERHILSPLGMTDSNASIDDMASGQDYALPYSVHKQEAVRVKMDALQESIPGGGINSSARDMAIWLQMLLNGGKHNEQQVIQQEYLERAFSDQVIMRNRFSFNQKDDLLFDNYGYGWAVNQYLGTYRVSHSGAVSGYTATIELFPFEGFGIVVLTNQHLSAISNHISDLITRRMLQKEQKVWQDYEVHRAEARIYDEPISSFNQESMPSLPIQDYEGTYYHPGYGGINVTVESGKLHATFPAFIQGLEHVEGDNFYNKGITPIHQNCPSFNMTFLVENKVVNGLSISFTNEGVLFQKKN